MTDSKRITRREFLKGAAITGGAVAVGGLGWRIWHDLNGRDFDPIRTEKALDAIVPAENPSALPNIILILIDDLGYGDLPVYGGDLVRTPNIDRLAKEGALFTQAYSTAPVCSPSRAGLLTGRYPVRSHMTLPLYPRWHPMGIFLYTIGRYAFGVRGIPEDELLLPEILRQRGYHTGMVGKWHLGGWSPHLPNDNGFDNFYGVLYSNDMDPFVVYRDQEVVIDEPVDQNMLTYNYTQETLTFIEQNRDRPFFLYLSHTMVHEPLHASVDFRGKSQAGLYGDAVEELDWSVGEILAALQTYDIDNNTMIIFTSDNGPWWQGSPGGFRGRKHNLMEGGFRVPFITRWPGVIQAGQQSDSMVVNFDIFATCLDAAGVPLPNDRIIDGESILPLMGGEKSQIHDTFYYYDGHELVAVRRQDWKYHRRHMSDNGGYPIFFHGPFLFDLARDPTESYSLIESEPETAQQLALLLDDWELQMKHNVRGWR